MVTHYTEYLQPAPCLADIPQPAAVDGYVEWRAGRTWYQRVGGAATRADTNRERHLLPLLALHGGPGATHWNLITLNGLAAATGREVIYYDQIGCGASAIAPGQSSPEWSVELFVEELCAVREQLGLDRLHLFGHSWGGMLAQEYALTQPSGVASLTLASSFAAMEMWLTEAWRLLALCPDWVQEAIIDSTRTHRYDTDAYIAATDEYYRRYACAYVDEAPDFLQAAFDNYGQVLTTMWGHDEFAVTGVLRDWDVRERLGEIIIPTLITSGVADECTPWMQKVMADRIPNARWELLQGTHSVHIEQRDRYNRLLAEFLQQHD
ncbi:MAG: proline iminopeptidase-family hydrolase [Actinomycetes bacterium]|jgi:proline-specific peptidase|nr:proline iminopeptidase-family hydrolase [Actinomycetes bacterium]